MLQCYTEILGGRKQLIVFTVVPKVLNKHCFIRWINVFWRIFEFWWLVNFECLNVSMTTCNLQEGKFYLSSLGMYMNLSAIVFIGNPWLSLVFNIGKNCVIFNDHLFLLHPLSTQKPTPISPLLTYRQPTQVFWQLPVISKLVF